MIKRMAEREQQVYATNQTIFTKGALLNVKEYYNDWKSYDQDLNPKRYLGPFYAAQAVAKLLPNQFDAKIADIGAGTGKVGIELQKLGYIRLVAIEGASERIMEARDIYESTISCYIGEESSTIIPDDEFLCAVSSGVFGPKHMKVTGIDELIRIVKPGGIIVSVMREEFFYSYEGKLEDHLKALEERGCLEQIEKTVVDNYFCGKAGIVLCHKVLVSQC